MSILGSILRRREPAVQYRTVDGGHPAPYPDMTDEQLYNYEVAFNLPKRTFDKPPTPIAGSRIGRTDAQPPRSKRPEKIEPELREFTTTFNPSVAKEAAARQFDNFKRVEPQTAEMRAPEPVTETLRPRAAPATPAGARLDLSKPVRTITTKQPVDIITTRARHPIYKVHGYIGTDDVVTVFTLDGRLSENGPVFLENARERHDLHLNIYPNPDAQGKDRYLLTQHATKEEADAAATAERIACVRVGFDE